MPVDRVEATGTYYLTLEAIAMFPHHGSIKWQFEPPSG
jgi:hypothetical protein